MHNVLSGMRNRGERELALFAGRLGVCLSLLGCAGEEAYSLRVDLRTDYVPVRDFDRVEVSDGTQVVALDIAEATIAAEARSPFLQGNRVALFEEVAGDLTLELRLLREGQAIAIRRVATRVEEDAGVTVGLTRDCADISCDAASSTPSCLGARCVAAACLTGLERACAEVDRCAGCRGECIEATCYAACTDGVDCFCDTQADVVGCEDFEHPGFLSAWDASRVGPDVGRSAVVHGGSTSGRFAQAESLSGRFEPPFSAPEIYMRAQVHLRARVLPRYISFFIVHGLDPRKDASLDIRDDGRYALYVEPDDAGAQQLAAVESMPLDRWVCLEYVIRYGPEATTELFVDGLSVRTTGPHALEQQLRSFQFGAGSSGDGEEVDVHLDDVVLDTAPVGCD